MSDTENTPLSSLTGVAQPDLAQGLQPIATFPVVAPITKGLQPIAPPTTPPSNAEGKK